MQRSLRRAMVVLLGVIGLFAVTTLVALEGQEVVIVRTLDAAGHPHETRTWVVDADGAVWIEAATPARPFAQHIARDGRAEIVRNGDVRRYDARIVRNPDGHGRIRALLAEKYGWADRWIGLLQDTSSSIAIRFVADG